MKPKPPPHYELIFLLLAGDLPPIERDFAKTVNRVGPDRISPKQRAWIRKILRRVFPEADLSSFDPDRPP